MDWRKRVLDMMDKRGIASRSDLCFHAGISTGTLALAMRGNHELKTVTMDKIARALDTSTAYLLYGDERYKANPAREVPLLLRSNDVYHLMYDRALASRNSVQVGGKTKVTSGMFAWVCGQKDMMPRFQCGDLMIIDKTPFAHLEEQYHTDTEVVAMGGVYGGEGFSSVFVRYLEKASDGWYWRSSCDYAPIKWDVNDQRIGFIGLVVQNIVQTTKIKPCSPARDSNELS